MIHPLPAVPKRISSTDTWRSVFLLPAKLVVFLTRIIYQPLLIKYLAKERVYTYRSIRLRIHPDVFHPGFFFSTKLLLKQALCFPLAGRSVLELGAGSGLISLVIARAGAKVTASDINPSAVQYLLLNAKANNAAIQVIESDLFSNIKPQVFDMILINPPYYFKPAGSYKERAWNCGENGEYFRQLFAQVGNYAGKNTVILMILCEGSERERIQELAKENGLQFSCIKTTNNLIEKNYIYRVIFTDNT